jgi:hypothetical protein
MWDLAYGYQLVSRPDVIEPIKTTTLPSGPWRDLAVDLLGPLPTGESILVVIDYRLRSLKFSLDMVFPKV